MLLDTNLEKQYLELRSWFAYRYLYQNPKMLEMNRYREFYEMLDKYFMDSLTGIEPNWFETANSLMCCVEKA